MLRQTAVAIGCPLLTCMNGESLPHCIKSVRGSADLLYLRFFCHSHYQLIVVQQVTRGCAFGSNLLSRVPCSPPLNLRLKVSDGEGREISR